MTRLNILSAVTALSVATGTPLPFKSREPEPLKECLKCGKEHNHNNCFCSADCCKAFKQQTQNKEG